MNRCAWSALFAMALFVAALAWAQEEPEPRQADDDPPPAAGPAPKAAKKAVRFTPVEQAVADKIMKENPKATVKTLRNRFCPITGKLADPAVPPLDVPQKFRGEHLLVAVADAASVEKALAALPEERRKDYVRSLGSAAANNMLYHTEGKGKNAVKEMRRIELPADQRAPFPAPKDIPVALTIDASKKHQTIEGLGTATYAHNRITWDIYKSEGFDKLIADDLGMSMVRFPLVPCFFETVEKPEQITREKFQFSGEVANAPKNAKGRITAHTTPGGLECLDFIQRLVKVNPEIRVVGSVWSPPHWMKNSNAQAGGGALKPEYYRHFARYLIEWVRFVKEKYGIEMYAISPQNELAFSEPYDSCVYKPADFATLLGVIGEEFEKEKINIKVFGPEDMTKHLDRTLSYIKAIQANPAAAKRLDVFATHGYEDGIQSTGSVAESSEFWNAIKQYGKPHWMTETGTGAADNRWNDGGPDGKTPALDRKGNPTGGLVEGALSSVGGRLHYALAYGNTSAWLFWQITGAGPSVHSLISDGKPDNKYYVAKHYWKWIRPGAVRIDAGPDGGDKGVCISAYQHERNRTVTVVLLNRSNDNAAVSLAVKTDVPVTSFEAWRSTETEHCAAQPAVNITEGKATLTLPPRSIVTLLGTAR